MNRQHFNGKIGVGRGRKLTTQGALLECAKNVIINFNNGGSNVRYNTAYFGKAMRFHLEHAEQEGLFIGPATRSVVNKAEVILKQNCDGKVDSFLA